MSAETQDSRSLRDRIIADALEQYQDVHRDLVMPLEEGKTTSYDREKLLTDWGIDADTFDYVLTGLRAEFGEPSKTNAIREWIEKRLLPSLGFSESLSVEDTRKRTVTRTAGPTPIALPGIPDPRVDATPLLTAGPRDRKPGSKNKRKQRAAEDAKDVETAKRILQEIKDDPSKLLSGEALDRTLEELQRPADAEPRRGDRKTRSASPEPKSAMAPRFVYSKPFTCPKCLATQVRFRRSVDADPKTDFWYHDRGTIGIPCEIRIAHYQIQVSKTHKEGAA